MDDSTQAGQWWLLGSVAAVLALCRTDLLVALACGFGVRWVQRRVRADGFATGGLVLAAVAATAILVHRYPHARYPPGVPAVQLGYNVEPLPLVTAASFLLPALGPLLLARAPRLRPVVVSVLQRCSPLVGVIAGELVLAAVLGEIDEVRLLFPLAFPLAVVGIELWRAVVPAIVTPGAPVRWATDDAAPSRRNDP